MNVLSALLLQVEALRKDEAESALRSSRDSKLNSSGGSRPDYRLSVSFLVNPSEQSTADKINDHFPSSECQVVSVGNKRKACTSESAVNKDKTNVPCAVKKLKTESEAEQTPGCPQLLAFPPGHIDDQQHTQLVLKLWNKQQQVQKIQYLYKKKLEDNIARAKAKRHRREKVGPKSIPNSNSNSAAETIPSPSSKRIVSPQIILSLVAEWVQESRKIQFPPVNDKRRRKISLQQAYVLEKLFALEPFPTLEVKRCVATSMNMCERSITVWFQNKRARLKRLEEASPEKQEKEEITFHNLTVGNDGKLEVVMMPEFRV